MTAEHARANGGRRLPLRVPGVPGRGTLWPRLIPASELPRRGVLVRLVLALVLAQPRLVHLLDAPATAAARPLSPEEVERLMRAAPRGVER